MVHVWNMWHSFFSVNILFFNLNKIIVMAFVIYSSTKNGMIYCVCVCVCMFFLNFILYLLDQKGGMRFENNDYFTDIVLWLKRLIIDYLIAVCNSMTDLPRSNDLIWFYLYFGSCIIRYIQNVQSYLYSNILKWSKIDLFMVATLFHLNPIYRSGFTTRMDPCCWK